MANGPATAATVAREPQGGRKLQVFLRMGSEVLLTMQNLHNLSLNVRADWSAEGGLDLLRVRRKTLGHEDSG